MTDKTPETLLDELLQLPTKQERDAFLTQVCKDNDALRARLEGLLLQHQEAGQFFLDAGLEAETEASGTEAISPELVDSKVEEGSIIGR